MKLSIAIRKTIRFFLQSFVKPLLISILLKKRKKRIYDAEIRKYKKRSSQLNLEKKNQRENKKNTSLQQREYWREYFRQNRVRKNLIAKKCRLAKKIRMRPEDKKLEDWKRELLETEGKIRQNPTFIQRKRMKEKKIFFKILGFKF